MKVLPNDAAECFGTFVEEVIPGLVEETAIYVDYRGIFFVIICASIVVFNVIVIVVDEMRIIKWRIEEKIIEIVVIIIAFLMMERVVVIMSGVLGYSPDVII